MLSKITAVITFTINICFLIVAVLCATWLWHNRPWNKSFMVVEEGERS